LSEGNAADEEDGTAVANADAADAADSTDNDATAATTRPAIPSAAASLAAKKARGKTARKNAKKGKKQKSRLMIAGANAAILQGTFPAGGYCSRSTARTKDCMTVSTASGRRMRML